MTNLLDANVDVNTIALYMNDGAQTVWKYNEARQGARQHRRSFRERIRPRPRWQRQRALMPHASQYWMRWRGHRSGLAVALIEAVLLATQRPNRVIGPVTGYV